MTALLRDIRESPPTLFPHPQKMGPHQQNNDHGIGIPPNNIKNPPSPRPKNQKKGGVTKMDKFQWKVIFCCSCSLSLLTTAPVPDESPGAASAATPSAGTAPKAR
jgi:hypothetical protein